MLWIRAQWRRSHEYILVNLRPERVRNSTWNASHCKVQTCRSRWSMQICSHLATAPIWSAQLHVALNALGLHFTIGMRPLPTMTLFVR